MVVGAPLDVTGTFRSGYRDAPLSIRRASSQIETYSWRYSHDAEHSAIHDLGDLVMGSDVFQAISVVEESTAQIRTSSKIPLVLGGEHTVTFGSFLGSGADKLLVFDAHMDLRDEYQGATMSHATWLRRLVEKTSPDRVMIVGARATSSEELSSDTPKVRIVRSFESGAGKSEFVDWVDDGSSCHVSVDMDFFDPAYAPGVGNPEPEGATPSQLFDLLASLRRPKVVGVDVCELVPSLDPAGISSVLASKVLVELISLISVKHLAQ